MVNSRQELALYRLQTAKEDFDNAKADLENGFFKGAANRSYYAIFHGMRALLALVMFDSKKHSGIISAFQKEYLLTDKIPRAYSKVIHEAFVIRNKCDYDDFYLIAKSEAEIQVKNADEFLLAIEHFLSNDI